MKRYCYALDLVDNPISIEAYERYHRQVWPEVLASIRGSGILHMEIYRVSNRLFMVMETVDDFDADSKAKRDLSDAKVMEWERVMWEYQQALPSSRPGEKWLPMKLIFDLDTQR